MKKSTKIIIIIVLLLILVVAAILARLAYARYVERVQEAGITSAQVASIVCEMDVRAVPASKDISVVSPYCIVKVRNYKDVQGGDRNITEVDERYTITMSPKSNFENPGFYWVEVQNDIETIIARNQETISGTFSKDEAQEKEYKIVFQNLGEVDDLTKLVNFNLVSEQIKPE